MSPRKIPPKAPLASMLEEARFTRSALQADPDAGALLTLTDPWQGQIRAIQEQEDQLSQLESDTSAQRQVANSRLDMAVIGFTDALLYDVRKDRADPRWTYFCPTAPSQLVREPLADQHRRVSGWLANSSDPTLEAHRDELARWVGRVGEALAAESTLEARRAALWTQRQALAEAFTAQRDDLARQLEALAAREKLGRGWSATFFLKTPPRPEAARPSPAPAG